jgi:hypothetical protein
VSACPGEATVPRRGRLPHFGTPCPAASSLVRVGRSPCKQSFACRLAARSRQVTAHDKRFEAGERGRVRVLKNSEDAKPPSQLGREFLRSVAMDSTALIRQVQRSVACLRGATWALLSCRFQHCCRGARALFAGWPRGVQYQRSADLTDVNSVTRYVRVSRPPQREETWCWSGHLVPVTPGDENEKTARCSMSARTPSQVQGSYN